MSAAARQRAPRRAELPWYSPASTVLPAPYACFAALPVMWSIIDVDPGAGLVATNAARRIAALLN